MRIISFSDIHLEFAKDLRAPVRADADLMILSGDIINFDRPEPLGTFLQGWDRPVIYVPGNHEYYTNRPMGEEDTRFRGWLARHHPNVTLLLDAPFELGGVQFFGGTMWTDFARADGSLDDLAVAEARKNMTDYELIRTDKGRLLEPQDTVALHAVFKEKLIAWLETPLPGPRVVVTHHAPVLHPQSVHADSMMIPAFNSLDMAAVIEKYRPAAWFYGHTHECDRQKVGATQLMSNQLGYQRKEGAYECQAAFDPAGAALDIGGA